MRRKNTFYKATALAMTSVLTLGAPVIAHAENTEGTDLSDEGYPEINPEIATLENQELEIWLPADQGQDPNFQTVKEKFEESYPNITINYNTSIPWEEMPSNAFLTSCGVFSVASKNCRGVISKYSQIFKNCFMEGNARPEEIAWM